MVVKTDPCNFSEFKIYPGRGKKFCAKDGKVHFFISRKVASLFHQKKKPQRIVWTQMWRRAHKKLKSEETTKRRTRRTQRVQKAIVGMTLDEIKRRKDETQGDRQKIREAAAKEVRDKKKQKMEKKKVEKKNQPKNVPSKAQNIPKKGGAAAGSKRR